MAGDELHWGDEIHWPTSRTNTTDNIIYCSASEFRHPSEVRHLL